MIFKPAFFLISIWACFYSNVNHMSTNTSTLTQPDYLNTGDTVAIVAPAGVSTHLEKEVNQAKAILESWGLHVVVGKNVFKKSGHFAGTDQQRIQDLQKFLDDPTIKGIWCTRGGYGMIRIIDQLNFNKFMTHPKWVIGFSDITVLHSHIHQLGIESLHAVMCSNLSEPGVLLEDSLMSLKSALFGELESYTLDSHEDNIVGTARGVLVGGNLNLLANLTGSKSQIDTSGKLIFIEDIGEYKYQIDRQLQSLKRAGFFDNCSAVIVGDFSNVKPNNPAWAGSVESLIREALDNYSFPIAFGFPAGHEPKNLALILGRTVTLEVNTHSTKLHFETNSNL